MAKSFLTPKKNEWLLKNLQKSAIGDIKMFPWKIAANCFVLLTAAVVAYYYYQKGNVYNINVILIPLILQVILFGFLLRNNPNSGAYYLSKPSRLSKGSRIIIAAGIAGAILLYIYAQCQQYLLPIGSACVQRIFSY